MILEMNNLTLSLRLILRNYMAQDAIELAEAGDYSGVRNLLQILNKPYDDVPVSTAGKKPQVLVAS